jgi:hypothetical protein
LIWRRRISSELSLRDSLEAQPSQVGCSTSSRMSSRWIALLIIFISCEGDGSVTVLPSLRVHYPYNFFSPSGNKNWRKQKAIYNESLAQSPIHYKNVSRAQDHEDIWLYENWFYGFEHGIIMESGALDGIQHSTSLFFENVLKWTSIHIG